MIHQLTVGGSQKSLLSALNAIDYEKNDVTLYVRKNKLDLINSINQNVNVIVNDDTHHYYRKYYSLLFLLLIKASKLLGKKKLEKQFTKRLSNKINNDKLKYEYKSFFADKRYDVAISYISNWHCRLVAEYIVAKKKICFHFDSTDFSPEIHKIVFPYFNQIVVDSNGTRYNLIKSYPEIENRFIVINNYVDYEAVIKKSKAKVELNYYHKYMIVTCGRLTPIKGFDLAVMAASILKKKGIDFFWYFVGDGSEKINIEQMIFESNLNSNIFITGMVDNPYPYIKACNIYVQPSYSESYGLTITEAKMLNKPIVSTLTAGGSEQIEDGVNGVLTNINPEAIADGIFNLLNSSEKINMIKSNLESYDYSTKFEEFKSIWERLIQV